MKYKTLRARFFKYSIFPVSLLFFLIHFSINSQTRKTAKPPASPSTTATHPAQAPLPPPPEPARTTLKKGLRALERGQSAEALAILGQAADKCQAEKDLQCEAEARRGLGDAYARQGTLFTPTAVEQYNQSVELFRKKGAAYSPEKLIPIADMKFNAQMTLAKIGDLYYKQRKYDEAEKYYGQIAPDRPKLDAAESRQQVQKARDVKNKPAQTKNRVENVGRSLGGLLSRKPSRSTVSDIGSTADAAANTAKDVEKTVTGVVEDVHRANLSLKSYCLSDISLGRVALARGNETAAQERFDSALNFATHYPPFFGKNPTSQRFQIIIQTDQGDLSLKQKRYADAAKKYQEARDKARGSQRPDLSWPASRGLGQAQWALAQAEYEKDPRSSRYISYRDSALAAYRESISVIEELRGQSIRGDEARQSFSAQTADVYQEYTQILAGLTILSAGGNFTKPLDGEALRYASEAFRVAESARSRALLDLMAESGVEIQTGIDHALLQKRQELTDRQTVLADQLIGLGGEGRGNGTTSDDDSVEREINQLEVQTAELEAQIRAANPRYASFTSSAPLSLEATQEKLLDDQTILLSYLMDENHSLLWVIGKRGVWLHSLGPSAQIDERVAKLRELLKASADSATPDPVAPPPPTPGSRSVKSKGTTSSKTVTPPPSKATGRRPSRDLKMVKTPGPPPMRPLEESPEARKYAESAFNLYFALMRPAVEAMAGKKLIIIPDGSLYTLPFEALITTLPTPGGEPPADYASLPYLIQEHVISYAPSATVLAAMKTDHTESKQPLSALLVGDPVFDPNDSRVKKEAQTNVSGQSQRDLLLKELPPESLPPAPPASSPAASGSEPAMKIPRLPATRTEVNEIAKLLRQNGVQPGVFLDLDANESLFRTRDLQGYQFVHLATHGLLNADHPESSGLLLSLVGNPPEMDGFLRTREIFNLRLGSPIVMLSACKTGLGQLRKGEGLIGLTRAFVYAGARDVGVSLWPVDDNSTAQLMSGFYGRLLLPKDTSASSSTTAQNPAAALRMAQIDMINGRKYSPPYFWAPFILVGQ